MDLALNNLQWLIYHQTKPTKPNLQGIQTAYSKLLRFPLGVKWICLKTILFDKAACKKKKTKKQKQRQNQKEKEKRKKEKHPQTSWETT